ncbi:hypothetical protein GGTG_04532 [Gaeumannomyces tritici R3-111a-1]|uniref:Uncharacterized protein n=1 Tax=Gaeumannomyces tritici (strain R3-111a-1) TaxID=644352 RepID=J3NTD3_GAET3|nr:hypothetical protein GGTG_04532 [Gaeumannomyces tritici R3-111a-1]EJT79448.1 hypothetical protein GGTG_04532 [Gaeumannomyces tritici R3-111a-1]
MNCVQPHRLTDSFGSAQDLRSTGRTGVFLEESSVASSAPTRTTRMGCRRTPTVRLLPARRRRDPKSGQRHQEGRRLGQAQRLLADTRQDCHLPGQMLGSQGIRRRHDRCSERAGQGYIPASASRDNSALPLSCPAVGGASNAAHSDAFLIGPPRVPGTTTTPPDRSARSGGGAAASITGSGRARGQRVVEGSSQAEHRQYGTGPVAPMSPQAGNPQEPPREDRPEGRRASDRRQWLVVEWRRCAAFLGARNCSA